MPLGCHDQLAQVIRARGLPRFLARRLDGWKEQCRENPGYARNDQDLGNGERGAPTGIP